MYSSLLILHQRWIPRFARNDKQDVEQYCNIECTHLSTQLNKQKQGRFAGLPQSRRKDQLAFMLA